MCSDTAVLRRKYLFLNKWVYQRYYKLAASQVALVIKNPSAHAGDARDVGSIPWLGRSPGGAHSNPLQYSCLENLTERGALQPMVHRLHRVGHDWSNLANMYILLFLKPTLKNIFIFKKGYIHDRKTADTLWITFLRIRFTSYWVTVISWCLLSIWFWDLRMKADCVIIWWLNAISKK